MNPWSSYGNFHTFEPIYRKNVFIREILVEKFPPFVKEINLTISSIPVQVQERRINATWNVEMAQDLATYHSIDAESELAALLTNPNSATRIVICEKYKLDAPTFITDMLAQAISEAIDRQILDTLLSTMS